MAPNATKQLAEYVVGARYDALPEKTVAATMVAFLDWAGCAVAGGQSPSAQAAANVVRDEGATGNALVFADGSRSSAHWAAFANGLASHTIELDDVHMESIIHGGVCVAPAALAVAEQLGADGHRLTESLLVGFDVTYRVGAAIAKTHYERFHATGTVGTLGAAAAAAKLMGLSVEQTQWALGNAGSQAAALWQYLKVGDDTKVLHPGKAAMNGVLAASLARHGFTGSVDIIEGERGFVKTMADSVDWDVMLGGLGRDFRVEENGYKIHSCCRHGHVSIDQAIRLAEQHDIKPEQVKRVVVALNSNSKKTLNDPNPPSPYKAKFSIHYMMAMSFLYRRASLGEFSPERLADPKVRTFMQRVEVVENPEFTRTFPKLWTAEVTVELADGRVLKGRADMPEGDPVNPVAQARLEQKCLDLMTPVLGPAKAKATLQRLVGMPDCKDARSLFQDTAVGRTRMWAAVGGASAE
jgi:2-methylcitrate dehydratase PrpD